jgi:thymidylate synthase
VEAAPVYISEETLDDLLLRVMALLLQRKKRIHPTRALRAGGSAAELMGVMLKIRNPRARLSRTERRSLLFGCLGELLWYLAKSNRLSFITYYLPPYSEESDDGLTVHGAYGPRLFDTRGQDQVRNVIELLKKKPESRRAVVQLFDATDLAEPHRDIPCTCTLQFMIRDRRLHMLTHMRSNDVFKGLPHDIFAFTMIQEIVARSLGIELGGYKHAVGSLHLYEADRPKAVQFVDEGWQERVAMPPMPTGDPWKSIRRLLREESLIRHGRFDGRRTELDGYWGDIVRLLQIFRLGREGNATGISALKREMTNRVYNSYIERRRERAARVPQRATIPVQQELFPLPPDLDRQPVREVRHG